MSFGIRSLQIGALLLPIFSVQLFGQTQHRIGVRVVNGAGQLYDRQTGEIFIPRGNDFVRLAPQSDLSGGTVVYMSMFNPGDYNTTDMESALSSMQVSGYNMVKVWLNELAIGSSAGGLSAPYLDNLADFLARAKAHGLYTMITISDTPGTPEFQNLVFSSCCSLFASENLFYLTTGGVQAYQKFWQDLITGLQARSVSFDNIVSYEINEEVYFEGDAPPLSLNSGTVTAANLQTYDMGSPTAKQQMMDDNLVYWIDNVRSAVRAVDPTALVTVGFFWPQQPNPARIGDPRLINTRPAIVNSQADIIDLQPYLDAGLTLPQMAQNYGIPAVSVKPIIMGEFGAAQASFDSAAVAAQLFQQWEVQSCQYGFSGWLLWTWDTQVQPGANFWNALSGGGVIDAALRPVTRPDACEAGVYLGQDLALGATASASGSVSGSGPQMAVDGLPGTSWNSGGFPPQWIQIDLPYPSIVSGVQLTTEQAPFVGLTVHDLFVQVEGGQPQLVTEFNGVTQDGQVLTWNANPPIAGVVSIRVETITTQSWVAWKDIEILSGNTGEFPNLTFIGSMPHIAAEENWTTTFTLVNKSTASAEAQLNLFGDAVDPTGSGPLTLPLVFPQQGPSSNPLLAASLNQTLPANASLIIDTAGPQAPPALVGSAQLAATGPVDGFAIFHQIPTGQEAVVPIETRNASSYLLAFDNTGGVALGVAVENLSAQAATIPIVIRDDTGAAIGPPGTTISLGGNGHSSFVVSTQYPATGNLRGTIEFDKPPGGQISVLGIRFTPPNNALTTIPVLANVGNAGGSIAHLASGGDGWETTFVLVNTGISAAQATLNFFADQTGAPLPLPLTFPQGNGAATTATSVTQALAAGATLLVKSSGAPQLLTGSAQLSTTGNVGGFVIFRHNNQEAVVPLESRNANAYILAFDNTNGTATGVAVDSVDAYPINITVVVRDDTGEQIATDTITLNANGHYAFTLVTDKYAVTDNIRGTIEFDSPPGVQIGALGIRIPAGAAHAYTTLPALAK